MQDLKEKSSKMGALKSYFKDSRLIVAHISEWMPVELVVFHNTLNVSVRCACAILKHIALPANSDFCGV